MFIYPEAANLVSSIRFLVGMTAVQGSVFKRRILISRHAAVDLRSIDTS
jgi:hypothetical protein